LHKWITQEEFDYYVKDFEQHGWDGGLNWYRVADINAQAAPQLEPAWGQVQVLLRRLKVLALGQFEESPLWLGQALAPEWQNSEQMSLFEVWGRRSLRLSG